MDKVTRHSKRAMIGLVGTLVVLIGIVMIPYPGPGWLVVVTGLGILSTEFAWAKRLREFTVRQYERWCQWFHEQHIATRASFALGTCMVVIASIWVVNGYGIVVDHFNLSYGWLHSPFFRA